jgi:hypothetical protein
LLQARHSGGRYSSEPAKNQAEELEAKLLLAIGARVMLIQNTWTDRGNDFSPLPITVILILLEILGLANGPEQQ